MSREGSGSPWLALLFTAVVSAALSAPGQADAVLLDPGFGDAGYVIDPLMGDGYDDVAVYPDGPRAGEIVVVGRAVDPDYGASAVVVARYTDSGQLDASFGYDGYFYWSTDAPALGSVVIAPDGGVVVGASDEVFRLDADGQLDLTFGDSGAAIVDHVVVDLAVDAAGRVLAGGTGSAPPSSQTRPKWPVLARLTPTGTLDGSFASGGYWSGRNATGEDGRRWPTEVSLAEIAALPGNGVALTGPGTCYACPFNFALASLDESGAEAGIWQTADSWPDRGSPRALTILPTGSPMAVGQAPAVDGGDIALATAPLGHEEAPRRIDLGANEAGDEVVTLPSGEVVIVGRSMPYDVGSPPSRDAERGPALAVRLGDADLRVAASATDPLAALDGFAFHSAAAQGDGVVAAGRVSGAEGDPEAGLMIRIPAWALAAAPQGDQPTGPTEPTDAGAGDDGSADDRRPRLSVRRLKLPQRPATLVRRGASASVVCDLDCRVEMRIVARGSAARRMGIAGVIGSTRATLAAGRPDRLATGPRRSVAAKLLDRSHGSLRFVARFEATRWG